jgi:hypothetical protein
MVVWAIGISLCIVKLIYILNLDEGAAEVKESFSLRVRGLF